jgi:DNA-directed RNA polymerase specialized sigma24 family protein
MSIPTERRWIPWTEEDRAVLREMYDAGASYLEIADRLSRTMVAIRQQCVNAGWCRSGRKITRRLVTMREMTEARRLRRLGWSYAKIAKEVDRPVSTVQSMLQER